MVVVLAVIAAAVGYLAYSKYREKQFATEVAQAISDPDAHVVKEWARAARLECPNGVRDVATVPSVDAGPMPVRFTCNADTGSWVIAMRHCTQDEIILPSFADELAKGTPTKIGDVYKPVSVICWEVVAKN